MVNREKNISSIQVRIVAPTFPGPDGCGDRSSTRTYETYSTSVLRTSRYFLF